jgi:pyrroloquinoline quinone biosynthesis protein B
VIEVRVLGTAQDGGVPQLGCRCRHCRAARRDPLRSRRVASLGLVDRARERRFLVEATPNLPEQWEALLDPGAPLHADGLFLTHAHSGHYAGLLHLGKEAAEVWGLPLYVTARMAAFLRANAPWSALVDAKMVSLRTLVPNEAIRLSDDLSVVPFDVPHRAEYTDTVGLEIHGPGGILLYVTDTDSWEPWADELRSRCRRARYALLDATFYSARELPGRDLSEVPHPFVEDNLDLSGSPRTAHRQSRRDRLPRPHSQRPHAIGIGTVAVYSDADRDALHVRLADEAVRIGPPPPPSPTCVSSAILEAARTSGAEAIHPGYGFLSENAAFARGCAGHQLVFVGPPAEPPSGHGRQGPRRKAAHGGGRRPGRPGLSRAPTSPTRPCAARPAEIGFPVLLKARRRRRQGHARRRTPDEELRDALERAPGEAGPRSAT